MSTLLELALFSDAVYPGNNSIAPATGEGIWNGDRQKLIWEIAGDIDAISVFASQPIPGDGQL